MYTVIELQDNKETVATLSWAFASEEAANQKYYEVLFHATSSDVPIHSAALFYDGNIMKNDYIMHPAPGEE